MAEAFAFPGVGVRFSGVEAAAARLPAVAARLRDAEVATGVDFGSVEETDSLSELDAQRFAYAFGVGIAEALDRRPAFTVGYSLGVYAAVAAAGALDFAAGLACVDAAWAAMRPVAAGALGAVVGFSAAELREMLDPSLVVAIANHDRGFVVSGPEAAVDALLATATARGALKALRVRASLPYHHPVLAPAMAPFGAFLEGLDWRRPACPVLSCVDRAALTEPAALRRHLAENLATPIDWGAAVAALRAAGVEEVHECGAGLSLSQNARMLDDPPRFHPLKKWVRA